MHIKTKNKSCFLIGKEIIDGFYTFECKDHGMHGVFSKKPTISGIEPMIVDGIFYYFYKDYFSFLAECN